MRVFQTTYKDAAGVKHTASRWYCELRDHTGKIRRVPGFTDRKATEALGRTIDRMVRFKVNREALDPELTKWVEGLPTKLRKVLARIGLLSGCKVAALRPLVEHLDGAADAPGFRQYLEAKGNTSRHVELTVERVRRIVEGCRFTYWSDLAPGKVLAYLTDLKSDLVHCTKAVLKRLSGVRKIKPGRYEAHCPVHQGKPDPKDEPALDVVVERKAPAAPGVKSGPLERPFTTTVLHCRSGCDAAAVYAALGCVKPGIGAASFNYYLVAFKAFAKWMVKDGRASESPVAHLDGVNARTDRRRERRALTVEEVRTLLTATEKQPERHGMTGPERAILYRVAVETGLRAGELSSLARASFILDGKRPTVTVDAAYSKRRRRDELPLRADTAAALRIFLDAKMPDAPAFTMPTSYRTAVMFRADLEAAGIAYHVGGRVADFHSLRHTTGSLLAASGVHPKVAQSLMRHSTIGLTMDRYTHTLVGQESDAVAGLPDLSAREADAARATGTLNSSPDASRGPRAGERGGARHSTRPASSEAPEAAKTESGPDGGQEADPRLALYLALSGGRNENSPDSAGHESEICGSGDKPDIRAENGASREGAWGKLEAAVGFEPTTYGGFAIRCLEPLGYAAFPSG